MAAHFSSPPCFTTLYRLYSHPYTGIKFPITSLPITLSLHYHFTANPPASVLSAAYVLSASN